MFLNRQPIMLLSKMIYNTFRGKNISHKYSHEVGVIISPVQFETSLQTPDAKLKAADKIFESIKPFLWFLRKASHKNKPNNPKSQCA